MTVQTDKNTLEAVFSVIEESRKVNERTGNLVESVLRDIGRLREQSGDMAVFKTRLDNIERSMEEQSRECGGCTREIDERIRELDKKREANKDNIAEVERVLTTRIEALREQFLTRFSSVENLTHVQMRQQEKESDAKFLAVQKDIDAKIAVLQKELDAKNLIVSTEVAKQGGKYGAVVALIISAVTMIITWAMQHAHQVSQAVQQVKP